MAIRWAAPGRRATFSLPLADVSYSNTSPIFVLFSEHEWRPMAAHDDRVLFDAPALGEDHAAMGGKLGQSSSKATPVHSNKK